MKSKKLVTGLIMACILAVVIIAGKNSVKVQAADGDVAIVTDGNGDEIGSYAALADAFAAAQNGYTICIISDIYDPSASIGYNDGEHNKHIIIDLNSKSVTLQMMNFDYSLYVKNGTLNCGITNGSVGFTNAMLTLSNVKFITDSINWMTKDGICLNNGSNVTLNGSQCWFEKLEMDTDCVFTVQNSDGLSNFGHIADGFDGVKEFVPEGLSVEGTTIIDDETGAKAKDFILRYRSLSDDADVAVSIAPKSYVYDGKEKKPAVTVSYGGKTLTEGKSYSCVYADNIDAGTATVTIKGENTMHGQIVEEFTIDKAKQKAPTGLAATAETVDGKNDGQISNLKMSMEYSVDKRNWLDCESTVLKKLADGNYYVRYKETKNYYASPAAKVVVKKGNVPATNEPTTNEPSTEKPTSSEQTTERQTTEKPTTEEITTEEQTTEVQSSDEKTDVASTEGTTAVVSKTESGAPNTGDDGNVALMLIVMMTCLLGAAGVVVYRREK